MSYEKTTLGNMQSYQRMGGWKYGPTVWPSYGYHGGGPAYAMFGMGTNGGVDISNVWSFYVLPASVVLLGAWAVLKISDIVKSRR